MLSYLWKRTSRVTCVTLVLWVGNETLRLLPSSSRCRQDSFRQRNLRSGWRVRQYDLTTSLRQRRRRAISQWIGVILYGFSDSVRSGRSRSVQRSVSFPTQRTRVTQVTRDVLQLQQRLLLLYLWETTDAWPLRQLQLACALGVRLPSVFRVDWSDSWLPTYQMSGGRRLLSEIERSPHSHRVLSSDRLHRAK